MTRGLHKCLSALAAVLAVAVLATPGVSGLRDADSTLDGYVDLQDYEYFSFCLEDSGPGTAPLFQDCLDLFDFDEDGDVDFADYAGFERAMGHVPIPLRDTLGDILTIDSTTPYSPRQTCGAGGCHDVNYVANGEWFQQGRTDVAGNVDMRDDYYGDGKYWIKSSGRYGKWGQTFERLLAAVDNDYASQMDQTAFDWVQNCSSCHVGGGPGERDRNDQPFYQDGLFGYERLASPPADVTLDGDYGLLDTSTGLTSAAPWDVTGVSGPDCLICHRDDRPEVGGADAVRAWRSSALGKGAALEDNQGQSVPAYAAAPAIGQGWFAEVGQLLATSVRTESGDSFTPAEADFLGLDPSSYMRADDPGTRTIDYSKGVADGSLVEDPTTHVLTLAASAFAYPPRDRACETCHVFAVVTGTKWFDERDVHYAKFNNLSDEDPDNDIAPENSTVCTVCHYSVERNGLKTDHNVAKGNSIQLHFRDELDYDGFRSCRDCHLYNAPDRHPDAPNVLGPQDTVAAHVSVPPDKGMMRKLSCQACHIPYALAGGLLYRDSTMGGAVGLTSMYYSEDPLDPSAEDGDAKWHPPLWEKRDSDGLMRWFPASIWVMIYWADWDDNGTPGVYTDDVIAPITLWRARQVTAGVTPPADGKINEPGEIIAYMEALKGDDSNGVQVAANPVLVRGQNVWYQTSPTTVDSFNHVDKGIAMQEWYPYIWEMDHNVLAQEEAWGYEAYPGEGGCKDCHRADEQSPVFDHLILVDPWDENGEPVYQTVKEMTGLETDTYHDNMVLKDSFGNPITVDSTAPYSGRQTCGGISCHDTETVSQGAWFQDGMTDVDGNLDMRDDYNGDGRFWIKSAARYGKWGQSFFYLLAAKDNTHASQIDQTAFAWVRDCSGCHPGSGPGERDRDGEFLWNGTQLGYELLPDPPADVALDGDYGVRNPDGTVREGPWDATGLSGPDCLLCHRADRPQVGGVYQTLGWRMNTLAAGENLVDDFANPVPAFAAAGTAGQGWFSNIVRGNMATPVLDGTQGPADVAFLEAGTTGAGSRATTTLQINYQVGVDNGSLNLNEQTNEVALAPESFAYPPLDQACWDCHPYGTITGTIWFDERDVHYKKFNNLSDEDPGNDIPPEQSTVCTYCHPGNIQHNVAKGHSHQLQYRNELDWEGFRSCRDCHLTSSPDRHPDAPNVALGDLNIHTEPMFSMLSCQSCHIPYPLYPETSPTVIFRDITLTANAALNPGGNVGTTARYYSANPLDPTDGDKSMWYPALCLKQDTDRVDRWFPCNIWISHYFGDWDDNGTPGYYKDDTITPVFLWRLYQAAGEAPRAILRDDDGDGRLEINQPDELLDYFAALKGNDDNEVQVAANPVLVRGQRVWYQDSPTTVASFEHVGQDIAMNPWYQYIWGLDHNVLVKEEAWGYDELFDPNDGCNDCHRPITHNSPVFDRKILIDSIDLNNEPVYETVREMTGLNPEEPVENP